MPDYLYLLKKTTTIIYSRKENKASVCRWGEHTVRFSIIGHACIEIPAYSSPSIIRANSLCRQTARARGRLPLCGAMLCGEAFTHF